jgi:hypothetical protein
VSQTYRRSRDRGTRAGARAQGATVDDKLIFNDPEAHMRRIREEQRRAERLLHDQMVRNRASRRHCSQLQPEAMSTCGCASTNVVTNRA